MPEQGLAPESGQPGQEEEERLELKARDRKITELAEANKALQEQIASLGTLKTDFEKEREARAKLEGRLETFTSRQEPEPDVLTDLRKRIGSDAFKEEVAGDPSKAVDMLSDAIDAIETKFGREFENVNSLLRGQDIVLRRDIVSEAEKRSRSLVDAMKAEMEEQPLMAQLSEHAEEVEELRKNPLWKDASPKQLAALLELKTGTSVMQPARSITGPGGRRGQSGPSVSAQEMTSLKAMAARLHPGDEKAQAAAVERMVNRMKGEV